MNWTAKHEQQEEALVRVFLMLVAAVLMTLRADMNSRRAAILSPFRRMSPSDARSIDNRLLLEEARDAVDRLLVAAEVALLRLSAMMRALYELMNHAFLLAASARKQDSNTAHQCELPRKRLDTS